MSKKEKTTFASAEDFEAIISVVPKLEALIKVHKEIAAGYQKYRKNGGKAISGIEKHLGIKEQESAPSEINEIVAPVLEDEAVQEIVETKKAKKKSKK